MLLSKIKAMLKRKKTEGTQKRFDTRMRVGSVYTVHLYHVKLSLVGDILFLHHGAAPCMKLDKAPPSYDPYPVLKF